MSWDGVGEGIFCLSPLPQASFKPVQQGLSGTVWVSQSLSLSLLVCWEQPSESTSGGTSNLKAGALSACPSEVSYRRACSRSLAQGSMVTLVHFAVVFVSPFSVSFQTFSFWS